MIYQLQDKFEDYDFGKLQDFDDLAWIVYKYAIGSYEGSGFAAAWNKKTLRIQYYDLGHCSCYGPTEGIPEIFTIDEFFAHTVEAYKTEVDTDVKSKVAELLGAVESLEAVRERLRIVKEEREAEERKQQLFQEARQKVWNEIIDELKQSHPHLNIQTRYSEIGVYLKNPYGLGRDFIQSFHAYNYDELNTLKERMITWVKEKNPQPPVINF